MYNIIAYSIYLSIALLTVFWVGRVLFKNGRYFLLEVFQSESLADSVNRMLYIGYCLVNSGCAFYHLNTCSTLQNNLQVFEFVSESAGQLFILIALMHYINLLVVPKLKPLLQHKSNINPKNQTL